MRYHHHTQTYFHIIQTIIMWSLIINIILYVLIIYAIHQSWIYLRDTYTIKKTKDLENTDKYKQIIEELTSAEKNTSNIDTNILSSDLDDYIQTVSPPDF